MKTKTNPWREAYWRQHDALIESIQTRGAVCANIAGHDIEDIIWFRDWCNWLLRKKQAAKPAPDSGSGKGKSHQNGRQTTREDGSGGLGPLPAK